MTRWMLMAFMVWWVLPATAAESLVQNGDFEAGAAGWSPLWTRTANAGAWRVDDSTAFHGRASARIEHYGEQDWSLNPQINSTVKPGDLYELSAALRREGTGSATLCAILYAADGHAVEWTAGARSLRPEGPWQALHSHIVIPEGVVRLAPRVIGNGPARVWVDDFSLTQQGNVNNLRTSLHPTFLTLTNERLQVDISYEDAGLTVHERRTGQTWQTAPWRRDLVLLDASREKTVNLRLLHLTSGRELSARIALEPRAPELSITVSGDGEMAERIAYPPPFLSPATSYLVIPMNEGISYPVEDKSIPAMNLVAFGGHGISMAFFGATDGRRGYMGILETPDDALIRIDRVQNRLTVGPLWDAQKGQFGYARRVRYVFLPDGGHVAMCKRYRAYVKSIGNFKTLQEKRRENPNVDLLVGALNVWCWERSGPAFARAMQEAGVQRILWSSGQSPENIRQLNEMGVLTSRYDIYQDVMNPEMFPRLPWIHGDWTTAAWPDDLMRDERGEWVHGWAVQGKDGAWYPCGVTCDKEAVKYARHRIPADLATHAYRCRFIDTTTASPWRECYDPRHPMTRSESRHWKMELLRYVSQEMKLVTGSETGHDAAVPYVDYFEGMLSLGPYRVPDAGRDMARIWEEVPLQVAKFQLGHAYRLPLWELVYHDCVVAQWYWGDYNNKLPALWDKRDRFNLLYGTPPMFMFNRQLWEKDQARFAESYRNTCPYVRAVGYAEMTDHLFLTANRDVQQTKWSNRVTITVNFGAEPFQLSHDKIVAAMGFCVEGMPAPRNNDR